MWQDQLLAGSRGAMFVLLLFTTTLAATEPSVAAEGDAAITNSIGMKLQRIPAGEFLMGSEKTPDELSERFEGKDSEEFLHLRPLHKVVITKSFYLGSYEVTVGQFKQFVRETGYETDAERDGQGGCGHNEATGFRSELRPEYNWRNNGFVQTDDHPVVNVSWNDAVAFCVWLSKKESKAYRLPTEAEWEYACKARSATLYCHGDDAERLREVANVADKALMAMIKRPLQYSWKAISSDDGYVSTSPVGQFKPNSFGLFDMHGNVEEWCADWYDEHYYGASQGNDPQGPTTGRFRVCRGGSWLGGSLPTMSAHRGFSPPESRFDSLGFRVVGAW